MPSTLYINGKVWQPDGSFNEAFGISEGHFDFVGSNEEAGELKASYKNVTDLGGKLILPGLIDGHLHLVNGSLMRKRLNASYVTGIDSLKKTILKYNSPEKEWIIGGNLDINFILPRDITGNFVDAIYFDKPLFITNYDKHSAIANTKALQATGILDKLSEFAADEVILDKSGIPTGLIKEKALNHIFENLPPASLDERVNAVSEFIELLHSYGITTVTDITLVEDLEVYRRLYELGKLNIRINSYLPFEEFKNLNKHLEYTKDISKDYFSISGFKAFWDGALGSETALFSSSYEGKGHNGYRTELVTSGRIYDIAEDIGNAGLQMIIHAIGDKAVSEVLDMYGSLYKKDTRHRIEHAQHLQENDFERFKRFDVIASVQPLHLKYDAKTVKEKLPAELVNKTHNYKHLIDNGAIVNFGTDFPIVEVDPFENIRLAVTRKTKDGVFTPQLCISLHDCIKGYTINNAYSNFNENAIGSIEKGKAADFVVMQDDLFEMDADNIGNARVNKTFLGGLEVY